MQIGHDIVRDPRERTIGAGDVVCLFSVCRFIDMNQRAGEVIDVVNRLAVHLRADAFEIAVIAVIAVHAGGDGARTGWAAVDRLHRPIGAAVADKG